MGAKRKTRSYTDEDKREAIALYALHGNYEYVGNQLDIPKNTLHGWINSDEGQEMLEQARTKNRDHMDERITAILDQALDVIQQQVQRYAAGYGPRDLREIGTVYGILYDKRALQRGESTDNVKQLIGITEMDADDLRKLVDG